jgi:hypothetical protein
MTFPKKITLPKIWFFTWLVVFTAFLLVSTDIIKNLAPLVLTYLVAIYMLLAFPLLLGQISFFWLFRFLKIDQDPAWVKYPIYFVTGLISLNLPYFLNSWWRLPPSIMVLIYFLGWSGIYWIFSQERLNQVWILNFETKWSKTDLLVIFIGLFLSLLHLVAWGERTGFVSTASDNLQNMHLGNMMNEWRYALFGSQLTPMYRVSFYTNFLVPSVALSNLFYNQNLILSMMYFLEVLVNGPTFFIRKNFFQSIFNLNHKLAALLSVVSLFCSSFVVYVVGVYLNQQVVVLLFTSLIFYLFNRRYLSALVVFVIGFPFHFIISTLASFYVIIFVAFDRLRQSKNYPQIVTGIFALCLVILGSITWLTYTDQIRELFLTLARIVFNNPSFLENIRRFRLFWLFRVVLDAFSPALIAIIVSICLSSLFLPKGRHSWLTFALFLHVIVFMLPIQFFGRIMAFFAIIVTMAIYEHLRAVGLSKKAIGFFLSLVLAIQFTWTSVVTVRTTDNMYTLPFFSYEYMSSVDRVLNSPEIQDQLVQDRTKLKVVSDYLNKHYIEIAIKKYDDYGFYEDSKTEREKNYLALTSRDPCQVFPDKEQILVVYAERTYRYLLFPERFIQEPLYNIFYERKNDFVTAMAVKDYYPNSQKVVYYYFQNNIAYFILNCRS